MNWDHLNQFPLDERRQDVYPTPLLFSLSFHILLSNNPSHYTSTLTIWVEDNLAFFQLILFSGIPYLHGRPSQSLLWCWSKICINWGWVSHIAIHMKKQTGHQLNSISTLRATGWFREFRTGCKAYTQVCPPSVGNGHGASVVCPPAMLGSCVTSPYGYERPKNLSIINVGNLTNVIKLKQTEMHERTGRLKQEELYNVAWSR